ncbi:MAG TPA: DUF1987 domain-containing protein [Bacteroidales bacterium]|nr:DUF1987 domain-containing protein [Bacteroidales bacterium]
MDKIELQSTVKTPYVLLDPEGVIKFRGRSIPEDVSLFFEDVLLWVTDYVSQPAQETYVEVEMEYLNSGTSKYMLRILKEVKKIAENGFPIKVKWIYEEGDDDIMERGEYYASILGLNIELEELE